MSFVKSLDAPLLRLSPTDVYTAKNACDGTHIFGGIGQGKTSGSGRALAGAFLRAGMGGLVCCVKPDEVALWQRHAKEHGRERSLIFFDENEGFNFLAHELEQQGIEGIGTVTECLMRILEAAKKASPTASQKGGEAFWEDTTRMGLRYSLLPLYSAQRIVTIEDIIRFISSAPRTPGDVKDPQWQEGSYMYSVMNRAVNNPVVPMDADTCRNMLDFWARRWPVVPAKTLESVVISITATLDRFLHGRLKKAFCTKTTIVPEMSLLGGIIILAMPTLTWNEDGIISQHLFKYLWERQILKRNSMSRKFQERFLFLWADEAQDVANAADSEFVSLGRSSKCAVCFLTQSLPNYFAKMGGDNPRDAATSLVGKFNTHVFHGNACPETNEWASRTIGRILIRRNNYSQGTGKNTNVGMSSGTSENYGSSSNYGSSHGGTTSGFGSGSSNRGSNSGSSSNSGNGVNWGGNRGRGTSTNESRGYSEAMEYAIEPGDFARILKNGGKANRGIVTGIWFQASRTFNASGSNMMLKAFKQ